MKSKVFCEGTTDIIMIQYVLQYKYGWNYSGFVENTKTNRLLKRKMVKDNNFIELNSCGGIMNIPNMLYELKELNEYATKTDEIFDKVIVGIDHDTISSNQEFIKNLNNKLGSVIKEEQINSVINWKISNAILGDVNVEFAVYCIPQETTGAIENIMLDALTTDDVEEMLISESRTFINQMADSQQRYLQKKSQLEKAVFNTYFAI